MWKEGFVTPTSSWWQMEIAGYTVTIGRRKFVVLKALIKTANAHSDALAGFITKACLPSLFHQGKGFSVQFEGTYNTWPFQRKQAIEMADDLLLFCSPMDGTRRYDRIFKWKKDPKFLRHVYRKLVR